MDSTASFSQKRISHLEKFSAIWWAPHNLLDGSKKLKMLVTKPSLNPLISLLFLRAICTT